MFLLNLSIIFTSKNKTNKKMSDVFVKKNNQEIIGRVDKNIRILEKKVNRRCSNLLSGINHTRLLCMHLVTSVRDTQVNVNGLHEDVNSLRDDISTTRELMSKLNNDIEATDDRIFYLTENQKKIQHDMFLLQSSVGDNHSEISQTLENEQFALAALSRKLEDVNSDLEKQMEHLHNLYTRTNTRIDNLVKCFFIFVVVFTIVFFCN